MLNALLSVLEFHQKMGLSIGDPRKPDLSVDTQLRYDLIHEEFEELTEALKKGDVLAVADALGDLSYVIAGAAATWGIDLGGVFEAIHDSNMTKTDGKKRADGKILKGPNYVPPDIQGALDNAKREVEAYGFGQDAWWPEPTGLKHSEEDHTNGCTDRCQVKTSSYWDTLKSIDKNTDFVEGLTQIMSRTITDPQVIEERDTEPTDLELANAQFLNRGAFVFDCMCGRAHEVPTGLGSRGGKAKTGHAECICGKVYDFSFSIREGQDHADVEIKDLGGQGSNQ